MACTVVFNAVSRCHYAAAQFRVRRSALANTEKSSVNAVLREDRQNLRGDLWVRTVINGDGHFAPLYRSGRQAHEVGAQAGAAWPQARHHQHQLTGHHNGHSRPPMLRVDDGQQQCGTMECQLQR